MRIRASPHALDRLKFLEGLVPKPILGRLAYWTCKYATEGSVAVGVPLPESIEDPTGKNYSVANAVGMIVREGVITTAFLGRASQFDSERVERGCATPEEHFNVDEVILKEG